MSEQMGGPFSNTAHPRYYCRQCGKPEHGSLACHTAPSWPINIEVVSTTKDARIAALEEELKERESKSRAEAQAWIDERAALEAEVERLTIANEVYIGHGEGCSQQLRDEVERLKWQLETLIDDTFNRTCFAGWSRLSIGSDLDRRWKART